MTVAQEAHRSLVFSLGLERLGWLGLARPWLVGLLVLIVTAFAATGLTKLKVDDSLSELFRTHSEEFRQYEEIDRRFPSSEYDVLVVVEGADLLKRKQLEAVSRVATELQLADGVSGIVSMLSARRKPDATGYAAPVVPDDLPEGEAYEEVIRELRSNEVVDGKFLSKDGQLAMIVLSLDRAVVAEKSAKAVIGAITEAVGKELEDTLEIADVPQEFGVEAYHERLTSIQHTSDGRGESTGADGATGSGADCRGQAGRENISGGSAPVAVENPMQEHDA